MSIVSYLQAVPKAELHVHLWGAVPYHTLIKLAAKNGVALPATTVSALKSWYGVRDWSRFAEGMRVVDRCVRTGEDYATIVYDYAGELACQNVRYAEVRFTPSPTYDYGCPIEEVFASLKDGRARAKADFGVEINWIYELNRQSSDLELAAYRAEFATEWAIKNMPDGVVALGLSNYEAGNPPEAFAPYFARARQAGLASVPHAGEHAGAESIWGAIKALGADRISHGVRAIEDTALVKYLAEQKIALEVCPTSNICLGVYQSLDEHPLRRLHDAGVVITINSDDPTPFNIDLNFEVELLHSAFGLEVSQIDEILLNGLHYSFLAQARKAQLVNEFRQEMAELKAGHF